ncbi:MAG: transporter substrate-binding domain-containing protein [Breznakibacter sp.]
MYRKQWTIISIAVVIGLAWMALCHDDSFSRLQKRQIIRIGYAVEAPYAFIDKEGKVTGESPETAKAIVSRLGIQHIEWRLSEFGSLIKDLQSGKIDVIATGMFINAERAEVVGFSEPVFHVRQGMLVQRGNPKQIHSYSKALELDDFKIAVIDGAIEEKILLKQGFSSSDLIQVPDAMSGRLAVEQGVADGLALSSPTITWMAAQNLLGTTEAVVPFEQPTIYNEEKIGFGAFVFRKEDKQLRKKWNDVQKTFIGSPKHLKLFGQFGFTPHELPGNISTKEILAK